jgi:ADP-ribosylglycohydrolase
VIIRPGKGGSIMIGAIIGDIVGSRFEFNNHRSKEFELFNEECFVTDDSIMTLAVAKAIIETDKFLCIDHSQRLLNKEYLDHLEKNTIYYMQLIGRNYPNCGYGRYFGKWIFSKNPKPYGSFGNGAAMRISPVGLISKSEEEVRLLSRTISGISHDHKEGIKGAEAVSMAIFLAKTGHKKQAIRSYMEASYYRLDFTLDEIRDTYSFNETCQDTVPQAIQAFYESDSFESAIRNAISIGGDSDTLAAITASIAEAYYGVCKSMVEIALGYLDDDLLEIYNEWRKIYFT